MWRKGVIDMRNTLRVYHDGPESGRIVMDSEFAKKSSRYGTQEFSILQEVRASYPKYHIIRKTIKRNPKKEAFKGLTYAYMEEYMDRHEVSQEIRQEYKEKRFLAKCHSIRYPHIKQWFLDTFPDVKNLGLENKEITNEKNNAADAAQVA